MIRQWARTHLDPDTHGGGQHGDEYRTTSVYFDTDAFDVFHRRGSFGRSKYRIRRYGDDETVFLERKMRQPAVLAKRRTILSLAALPQLTESGGRRRLARLLVPPAGHGQAAAPGLPGGVPPDGAGGHARRRTGAPDARLPISRRVPTSDARFPREADVLPMPAMPGRLILELKYRGAAPAIFRQLVEEFALAPQAAVEVSPRRGREWAGGHRSCSCQAPEPKRFYA